MHVWILVAAIGIGFATSTLLPKQVVANGLGENRAFQFRSANERAARTNQLNLQEAKKGGLLEAGAGAGGAGGETIINGDQINCSLDADSAGNTSDSDLTGSSGSITGVASNTVASSSTGNTATNSSNGESTTRSDQSNEGNQTSSADQASFTNGDANGNEGGQNEGEVDTDQLIEGTVTATVERSRSCGDFVLN